MLRKTFTYSQFVIVIYKAELYYPILNILCLDKWGSYITKIYGCDKTAYLNDYGLNAVYGVASGGA